MAQQALTSAMTQQTLTSDLPAHTMRSRETSIVPADSIAGRALVAVVAVVSLDDHRGWIDRMRAMARTAVGSGIGVLVLVIAATMLCVTFATRGAMAANRPVIEVLHFVGARHGFIAGQFQRHFLWLGLKGGALGGAAAMLLFAVAGFLGNWFKATAGEEQVAALFGGFDIGLEGY